MSTKPVIADMQCKTYGTAHGLWQYDYGQILRIQGLNLPTAVEIHFSLRETGGESVTRVGVTRDGVTDVVIPDSMLENGNITSDYYIYAFIYLTNESSGETTHKIRMKVQTRPRPEAFDTPEDAELFRGAIAAVNEAADRAGVSEENAAVSEQKTEEHLEAVDVLAKQVAENTAKVEELTQKTEMYAGAAKRGVQADMSVNDENDPAYVKNRTHWIDGEVIHKLPEVFLPESVVTQIEKNKNDISQLSGEIGNQANEIFKEVIGGVRRTSANINNCEYEHSFIDDNGADATFDVNGKAFKNIGYIPVEGGKSICIVGENLNDIGGRIGSLRVHQYDANKASVVGFSNLSITTSLNDLRLLGLNPETKYIKVSSWSTVSDLSRLKFAIYYSNNVKETFEEYSEETYLVKAIDYNNVKDEYGNSITKNIAHVTPEMFGAIGNGGADDTQALRNCIEYAKGNGVPIKCVNRYKISETLVVDFDYFDIEIEEIVYGGTDYTITFESCLYGRAKIKNINAKNGNGVLVSSTKAMLGYNEFNFGLINAKNICIKAYSEVAIQYNKFQFAQLKATDTCIFLETNGVVGVWLTENVWNGGQLSASYGIKAYGVVLDDGHHTITTQRFYNVGFEGVTNGCYLDTVHGFTFITPRTSESISGKVFILVGKTISCQFYLGWFKYDWIDCSQIGDDGRILNNFYGYFYTNGGSPYEFTSFSIAANGVMKNVNQKLLGYTQFGAGSPNKTLTLNPKDPRPYLPTEIACNGGCGEITLDVKYYNEYNINQFYLVTTSTVAGDVLKDSNGIVVVDLSQYSNKKLRLTKMHSVGGGDSAELFPNNWLIEEVG